MNTKSILSAVLSAKKLSATILGSAMLLISSVGFAQVGGGQGGGTSIDAASMIHFKGTTAGTEFKSSKTNAGLTIKDGTEGAGKVLTSDAGGNATWQSTARPGFGAVLAAQTSATGQAVTSSETDVHFTGEQWDTDNAFTPSTGVYVVPVAGKYLITGQLRFPGIATDALQSLNIFKNGAALVNASISFGDNGFGSSNTAVYIADLAVGDQIKLSAFSGVSTYIYGASFSAIKVD